MSDGLEASRRRARRNVVLTAAIAGLGGLLFGYDTGVIAGALLFIKGDFDLGSFGQGLVVAAVPIGILVAYLVGLAFDHSEGWRWMLGLGCVPALALGFGMLRMPQSPRWLVMSGDDFAARATLAKIRVDDPDTIDRELEEIKESLDEKPGAWSELLQPVVKAALVVGVGLAILQQVTGINTVIYYAPTIVEFTGVNSSAGSILAAVGVGVINVAMTLLALRLLDRAGRRMLLFIGVSGMSISLFALGAAFKVSGGDSTVASVIEALGRSGAFWFYGVIGLLTLAFCWKFVPETKGKRLEDIQDFFQERVDRRKARA
jgi:MFS family permease